MQELVFILHILAAAFLVVLILIQHGKGADMGAAFGSGASQTVFGSVGSLPFLIKVTTIVAITFFATSLSLGYFISKQAKQEVPTLLSGMPLQQTSTKLSSEAPQIAVTPVKNAITPKVTHKHNKLIKNTNK